MAHAALPSVLAAVLMLAAAAAAEARPNLLTNGDFEQWPADAGPPTAWVMVMGQSPTVFRREGTGQHGGAAALRVELGGETNTGWIGQTVEGVHPDTQYRLSGYARVAPGAAVPLNLNVEPNLGGLLIPPTGEWTRWEWTFNTREATRLMPQLRLRGQGTVWLDDLLLEQVGATGASLLPDRAELLKLLAYQAHPVDPATNTDDWAKPFRGRQPPGGAFARWTAAPDPRPLRWQVGQWARYLCHDDLRVPSLQPEKRPHVMLVDCAVIGSESIGGQTYYWYQSVVRLRRHWVAKAQGPYDSGEKVLLERERRAVVTLLVDGPAFADLRRYQLRVDDGPLLEYVAGDRAALPWLDMSHAWLRPFAGPGQELAGRFHPDVPVTGMVSCRLQSPQLSRQARLVNWGPTGARDERGPEPPLIIRLPEPPYVGIAFDGFGTPQQAEDIVAAGAGLLEGLNSLYLGPDRELYNRLPAYFFDARCWDVDLFDICRANFAGFGPHLDEPYQRQRKPNEYLKRGEAATVAEAADRYTAALSGLLGQGQFWPGHRMHSYDSPSPAAWYDMRAGATGFVLENGRLGDEIATIARLTGRQDDRALADELNIAFLAGAARRFGGWWGQGIYRWVPPQYWRDELVYYAARGAHFVGFWLEKAPPPQPETGFYDQVRAALPELVQAIRATPRVTRRPTVAFVVPYGVVVGLSGSVPEKPWGILDYPEGPGLLGRLITAAARLHDQGVTFDVVVDDPAYPPKLDDYGQVIRLP